jgi:hypothetical protein
MAAAGVPEGVVLASLVVANIGVTVMVTAEPPKLQRVGSIPTASAEVAHGLLVAPMEGYPIPGDDVRFVVGPLKWVR